MPSLIRRCPRPQSLRMQTTVHYNTVRSTSRLEGLPLIPVVISHVSDSLVTVQPHEKSPSPTDIVIRVALSQVASSAAVLQSLLALSSLHRHGRQPHAARLKVSAISALTASAKSGIRSDEVISHVSALMLLCSFEIQASETSTQWLEYISAVKNVLRSVRHASVEQSSEFASLLYWVSYHDILSRFSLRYWKHNRPALHDTFSHQSEDNDILRQSTMDLEQVSDFKWTCPRMLAMMSDVLAVTTSGADDTNTLTILEWKVKKYLACSPDLQDSHAEGLYAQLFQLALLVYIERTSTPSTRQSDTMRSRLQKAYAILPKLASIERHFPLLIVGCEAKTDEDRIIVLDLIARTEKKRADSRVAGLKDLIVGLWAQDDLSERELGYEDKIGAVLGARRMVPSFA